MKQTDEAFLQVTNYGMDRIALGMKFRNDIDAKHCMGLLQQFATPGVVSVVCDVTPCAVISYQSVIYFMLVNCQGHTN